MPSLPIRVEPLGVKSSSGDSLSEMYEEFYARSSAVACWLQGEYR